jgi:drug/metabolite transporter (DMT)-like permease
MNNHIDGYRGRGFNWKLVAALGSVYFVWGSTYLAIKVAVATIPPLLAAGVRFLIAGLLLYGWSRLRGEKPPRREQWPQLWLMGVLMFLVCYSFLFWAEKTVPSGVASVLVAMLPAWMLILEVTVLKTQRLTIPLVAALVTGFAGVALLTGGLDSAGGKIPWLPCVAVLVSEIAWAAGSILSKKLKLPASQGISAGAQMMCGGCLLLTFSGLLGEWRDLRPVPPSAVFAMLYLIVAGSLIAYRSYVWLLGRMSPTKVSSYAYVNPIVAMGLGYLIGGEALHANAIAGAVLVLASVFLILTQRASGPTEVRLPSSPAECIGADGSAGRY